LFALLSLHTPQQPTQHVSVMGAVSRPGVAARSLDGRDLLGVVEGLVEHPSSPVDDRSPVWASACIAVEYA
jgi:hypothetical protein